MTPWLLYRFYPSQWPSHFTAYDKWNYICPISQTVFFIEIADPIEIYRQVSNIRRTLVVNKIVDHSDVVGASPVGAAPTTSSFST